MHRALRDVVVDLRERHLAHADVHARRAVRLVVDHPRGLENQQAELFQLQRRVGDHALHELVIGEQLALRSEEHTSGLQSLMRSSYAVFCLKKKKTFKSKIHIYTLIT